METPAIAVYFAILFGAPLHPGPRGLSLAMIRQSYRQTRGILILSIFAPPVVKTPLIPRILAFP